MDSLDRNKIIEANIEVHTKSIDAYADEPHFRPENVARVESVISHLKDLTNGDSLLDIGCGTGFIIDIACKHFKVIRGVDVTPAMLERVVTDRPGCDIRVSAAPAEELPFEADSFDVCTAHAVLHHLHKLDRVFAEAFRVLRRGGVFYSDLDPNYYFWETLSSLDKENDLNPIILREIAAVTSNDGEIAVKFGVSLETAQAAEHLKHIGRGFKEEEVKALLFSTGFSEVEVVYEWFLGEASVIHNPKTSEHAATLREHLRSITPLTRHLFKYISFRAIK